jgi:hypothetical protein
MASVILPYSNLGEAIVVSMDLSKIPHRAIGERSVLVDTSTVEGSISIGVEARLSSEILDAFPPSERKSPPIEVLVTLISIDAGIRRSIKMKQQKPDLYVATASLDLKQISESAELCVFAVRTSTGSAKGFANHKGARLAWSPIHEIRFVERPTKGNFISTVWEDFSNSTVVPRDFEKGMYYVDAESDPPVLYLNKLASSPLVKLFQTQGFGHAKALPRDLLFRSIATNIWFVLAQTALEALHNEAVESGVPVDLSAAFGGNWKQEMIELLAPRSLPSLMPEDAIQEFCSKMDDSNYFANTLLRAQLAIQTDQSLLEYYEKFADREFANG